MNSTNYENNNLVYQIKSDFPNFDEQELLEYTQFVVPNIHHFFSYEKNVNFKKYCSDELIEKILEHKNLFRISTNIDSTRVGYARIQEYSNQNNKFYIKVYSSVFFYDDVDNNVNSHDPYDKYWNDIWVITYEGNTGNEFINKCPYCGASMEYNRSKHMFTCNYCRNSLYYSQIHWRLVDIEVNNINYK